MDTSALAFDYARRHGDSADTPAMRLGRLTHSLILNPDASDVAVYAGRRAGKAWTEFQAAHVGAEIVSAGDVELASAMREAVMSHPVARSLLTGGEAEVSVEWTEDGIARKARLDYVSRDGDLVELKTTRYVAPRRFAGECATRLYYAQVAWYLDALAVAMPPDAGASIVAVENVAPHDVVVYRVTDAVLEEGRRKIDGWLKDLRECLATGVYPGVASEAVDLVLPDWALGGDEEVDVSGIEGGADGSE